MSWNKFFSLPGSLLEKAEKYSQNELLLKYGIYSYSINENEKCSCFLAREEKRKILIVTDGKYFSRFEGETAKVNSQEVKVCTLSVRNSKLINEIFDFTNPTTVKDRKVSIGLGDRLGMASAGHLKLIRGKTIFPILAQQSIRELNLTGRSYEDVLSSAVWAVLQEGYKGGFGADGDHLKTAEEVSMALECGFTMITLDCSDYIDNEIDGLDEAQKNEKYYKIGTRERKYWEDKYLNKVFAADGGIQISIDVNELSAAVLIYYEAIDFAEKIYKNIISKCDPQPDFEISIDETLTPTNVKAHFIIAAELQDRGVNVSTMAPRFCGEFQKGIDYRGDIVSFNEELTIHNAIARHFGYRLSIHSGSDKFSVFPGIGRITEGSFHIKTAGTNWLEAMRVIALSDSELFKEMYRYSIEKLDEAKRYYHISTKKEDVPDIEVYENKSPVSLLNNEYARQALHITYGYLLCDKNKDGQYILRDKFFDALYQNEDTYYQFLEKHIGHHLETLGI